MNRHGTDDIADSHPAIDAEHEEVASLATKIATLPHQLDPVLARSAAVKQANARLLPRSARFLGRLLYGLAWFITFSLGFVAIMRIIDHDGTHLLIWLNAFTRYVYLPAYVCLAFAVWKRRWRLAFANAAIVSLHLVWIAPDFMRDRRYEVAPLAAAAGAPAPKMLRIFFANVYSDNTEHTAMMNEIKAVDPDVVVFAEFGWNWHRAFVHSNFKDSYPYGKGLDDTNVGSISVFSRIPLKSETRDWFAGRAVQTIELPVGSQTLRIVGLHAPRPMAVRDYDYEGYWKGVIPKLLAEKGPLVIVGDCNATQYSLVYERLTADRFRSAHEDRGRGYATSWPNGQVLVPPIRIDQAFLSPEVECVKVAEGEGRGSDHKPLILDVQVRAAN